MGGGKEKDRSLASKLLEGEKSLLGNRSVWGMRWQWSTPPQDSFASILHAGLTEFLLRRCLSLLKNVWTPVSYEIEVRLCLAFKALSLWLKRPLSGLPSRRKHTFHILSLDTPLCQADSNQASLLFYLLTSPWAFCLCIPTHSRVSIWHV